MWRPARSALPKLRRDGGRGEEVLPSIAAFCEKEKISSAVFSAIGAVKESKIGYYDLATKKYGQKEYPSEMEVASMTGNVALVYPEGTRGVDGKPFVHCHAVLSAMEEGMENQPIGGHVFEAKVAVTLEVRLTAFQGSIERALDNEIGLKLLDI